jgi:HTH-type transcriptional regulator/antitoxin HipB
MRSTPIASIRALASLARGRRHELGLTQAELAERMGVSRQWIAGFEAGKPGAGLNLVIRLLDALDLRLAVEDEAEGRGAPRQDEPAGEEVDLDALLDRHRGR